MQEPKKPDAAPPLVLHIRISGRWMPVLSAVSIFALLPALSASAPLEEGAPQTLSARSTRALSANLAGAAASTVAVSAARLAETTEVASALGGGAIDFPSLSMPTSVAAPVGLAPVIAPAAFARAPGFIRPISGPLMSLFGPRRHPVLGVPMFHTGIDLGASCGTPIRAAADGVVAYAGVTPSWGQRIIIEHDAQLKTGYAHLSRMIAKEGDVVRQGDVVGLVGTTGWSTGCHLHFDVILNEQYVDPRPYLGMGPAAPVSIPYRAAPYRVTDTRGTVVYTVEDGDVPIPPETNDTTTPVMTKPTTTPTTTTPTTSTPQTTTVPTTPTTTDPTTTTPPPTTTDPTTDPTTTTPPPTTTDPTTDPTTTTTEPAPAPTTTTTEPAPAPTTTQEPPTTAPPPTATATEPAPQPTTTVEPPPPTSDPTATSTTATSTTETAPAGADGAASETTTPPN